MKKLLLLSGLAFTIACTDNSSDNHGHTDHDTTVSQPKDTSKKSLPREVQKTIGDASFKISYHAPGVRSRTIWGGLVPYDEVWVTGAHNATTLESSAEFIVGNKTIPAGKYALFTIPSKEDWTIILNKNWDQHLADEYSEADDVVRWKVKPESVSENTERLTYAIEEVNDKTASITISWEKLKVPFQIELRK